MTTLEMIVSELNSVPKPLLEEVLSFIRSAKNKNMQSPKKSNFQRIAGLHEGQVWISDDFNDSLPDEFWFGDDN
jgi:hypothetical protein